MIPKDGNSIDFREHVDRTKQAPRDECDVNRIIQQMGGLAFNPQQQGPYVDCVAVPDFLQAQNLIARTNQQFARLPAEIRAKFGNDPMQVFEAMEFAEQNPGGLQTDLVDALERCGYQVPEPDPEPDPQPAPPPAPPATPPAE